MEVKRIGNIYGFTGGSYARNVYSVNGLSPNIKTMQGGNQQPMIIIGGMQKHQAIKKDGVCTCLTSSMGTGGGYVPMLIEQPKLLKDKAEKIGNLNPKSNQRLAVYNKEKSCPTLQAAMGTGGGQVPLIIDEPKLCGSLTNSGHTSNTKCGTFVTIAAMRGRYKDGSKETEQRLELQKSGLCNTLTGVQKDNMVIEQPKLLGGLGEKKSNGGTQYYQQDRVYSSDGVAMSHPAQIPGGEL